ncbi:hypothetical protein [Variovorax sp. KK3]|uniref:hypothetical protein n=1 Tax=Variovorax sp. KK3 TaxID=1855728 RepID=UPI00097C70D5
MAFGSLGCEGYTAEDVPSVTSMSAADHLRALDRTMAGADDGLKRRATLQGPCDLRIWSGQGSGHPVWQIALQSVQVRFDVSPLTGRYLVALSPAVNDPEVGSVDVGRWVDAVAFRSHVQQLQGLCLASGQAEKQAVSSSAEDA